MPGTGADRSFITSEGTLSYMRAIILLLGYGVVTFLPLALTAQEPTRAASLAAELRALRARVDSLERVVSGSVAARPSSSSRAS